MNKLFVFFIFIINSMLFSFEIPDNVTVIDLSEDESSYSDERKDKEIYYVLVTDDYYFTIMDTERDIRFSYSIKTPKIDLNLNYTKLFGHNVVYLENKTGTDKINLSFNIGGFYLSEFDITDNSYRCKAFSPSGYDEYSKVSDLHKKLKKMINDYGNNLDVVFCKLDYNSVRDNSKTIRANYKSFYKDFLTMLDLYRDITIDRL